MAKPGKSGIFWSSPNVFALLREGQGAPGVAGPDPVNRALGELVLPFNHLRCCRPVVRKHRMDSCTSVARIY